MDMKHFDDYQWACTSFAKYPDGREYEYLSLGLCSEAGEVADKLKKILRDTDAAKGPWQLHLTTEQRKAILLELGDVLWYTAMLAYELDYNLSDAASANIDKLDSREERGVIGGSGDDR